jgi:hypothetical protein
MGGATALESAMVHTICVRPFDAGWSVASDGADNDMLFLSGAKAEAAARALGRILADSGFPAKIEIWLRDGCLAAQFICPPASSLAAS